MKYPLTDHGTPEEEAWRWRLLPWYIRSQRLRETYLYTVKYYDKPEGEDLLGKIVACNRNVLPYATMWGVTMTCMHSGAVSFQQRFGGIISYIWPAVGAATAFASVAYAGAKIRKQDDFFNYAGGAIAAGSVIGFWQNSHIVGWNASLLFVLAAYVQRIRVEEGWKWYTLKEYVPGDHRWHKCNWDIYKDPLPKGYTTSTTSSNS